MGSTHSLEESAGGYLFDPANFSHAFGKNVGPGAFMTPDKAQGGSLYPGGPGLPGGQKSGEAANAVGAAIASMFTFGGAGAADAAASGASASGGSAGIGAASATPMVAGDTAGFME